MENHVPSSELCKKLKEVGYKQEGEFWWFYDKFQRKWLLKTYPARAKRTGTYVAPLASELMERLPETIDKRRVGLLKLSIHKQDKNFVVTYYNFTEGSIRESDTSLCNALAKMTILLVEKDY